MNAALDQVALPQRKAACSLERDFPIVEVSQIAEQESWRKEINRPLYHIHKWWATRLGSVFRAITLGALTPPDATVWTSFYERHCLKGKVVLDPFMGSGTTLGEAIKLGAKAIGCDVNPVSTFMVRQGLTRVSETALRAVFARLEKETAPEIRRYYETTDPDTDERIPVLYFFWVKIVQAPDGEEVPLFGRYVFAQDAYPKKKPKAQIVCPRCWGITEGRYDAPELCCAQCGQVFHPQEGPASGQFIKTSKGDQYRIKDLLPDGAPPKHRLYAMLALKSNGEKVYLAPGPADFALYENAAQRLNSESLPLPTLAVRAGHNTDQARGYNYLQWRDFFNARQLLCLGLLLKAILRLEDTAVQEQLLCLFSSTLEFNNLFCSYKGEGTGAVRHMFSNHILKPERMPLENSVWGTNKSSGAFSTLFESRLLRAKSYLDAPFEVALQGDLLGAPKTAHKVVASAPIDVQCVDSWQRFAESESAALVLSGDSAQLAVPDASIDAVITDPPYFDFVHYSELSDFFFAWLSPALRNRYAWFDREDSSDTGEVQHKNPRTFARQLARVFSECRRVLKDEGVLAFSFHHSREEGWAAIYEAIASAKLEVVAAHPVHAEMRGSSPKTAAKDPISLDAILVCRKLERASVIRHDANFILERTEMLAKRLSNVGMVISTADRFVIAASQTLINASSEELSYDEFRDRLCTVRARLEARASIGATVSSSTSTTDRI